MTGILPPTFVEGFHDEDAVKKIQYNNFGQTGLKISQISLGGGPFGIHYGDYDEKEAIETIREAIRKGINYIDTAPWYGQGKSERIIGKALKEVPRKAYYIATKIGRYELDAKKMFDFSYEKTMISFQKSLETLQLEYVDFIQVHDIEFAPNLDIILNETLIACKDIVLSKKASYIGVTGYPVSKLKECVEKSPVPISTILTYTRLSLIDRTLKEYIPYFQMQGIGIINASVFSMGLLTNDGPPNWHPADKNLKEICLEARKYCKEKGVELGKLALNFALSEKDPSTVLMGLNNTKLLRMNLDVFYNGLNDLEKETLGEINKKFFSKIKKCHWEGVEIEQLAEKLKSL